MQAVSLAVDGKPFPLWLQHPMGLIEVASRISPQFKSNMLEALRRNNGKLSILFYSDEITPGNVIASRNERKAHGIYWSVLEFGWPLLSSELAWFTIGAIRSSVVDNISGGISYVMRMALKKFFGAPDGADLRNGVHIKIGGELHLVHGSLGILIHDERAHKFSLHAKGASGKKPCTLCKK